MSDSKEDESGGFYFTAILLDRGIPELRGRPGRERLSDIYFGGLALPSSVSTRWVSGKL